MREYLELQLKKKAHELVMATFKLVGRVKGQKDTSISLRKSAGKIPAAIFDAQSKDFTEDKLKHFIEARNALFEARYYLDLLHSQGSISYYGYKNVSNKIDLLDKILTSRIRAIDKRKAKEEYKVSIRKNIFN